MDVVVHQSGDGTIAVTQPSQLWTAEEVARKDVPAGVPYLIVSTSDLPDFAYQAAWVADFSSPHGYGIGPEAWFAEQAAKAAAQEDNQ